MTELENAAGSGFQHPDMQHMYMQKFVANTDISFY